MILSRRISIGLPEVVVLDGLFSEEQVARTHRSLQLAQYSINGATSSETRSNNEVMARLDRQDFLHTDLWRNVQFGLREVFGKAARFSVTDVLVNCTSFGDTTFIHTDSKEENSWSILIYANSAWNTDWGAETVFYKGAEPCEIVSVRPGRVVVFPSSVEHRAGVPDKLCEEFRYTISIRGSMKLDKSD